MTFFKNDLTTLELIRTKCEEIAPESIRRILIINSGGTISMTRSAEGYVPAKNAFEEILRSHFEFHDPEEYKSLVKCGCISEDWFVTPLSMYEKRIYYVISELDPLIDSSCMSKEGWLRIASKIEENYDSYDGFVVLHGTDTMAYTASILSFVLENLKKPVILTGSQIPICEMRNDGASNLMGSLLIAGHFQIPEVCLYFNNKLYRGNRTIKSDNFTLDPFESPNFTYLVKAGTGFKIKRNQIRTAEEGEFRVHKELDDAISIITIFPCITIDTIRSALQSSTRGAILLSYGTGNIPDDRPDIIKVLKEATDRGVVIVNISQCRKGTISDSYHCGWILNQAGIVSGRDMTMECAITKLSYLLGKYPNNPDLVRILVGLNLKGELTESVKIEFKLNLSKLLAANTSNIGFKTGDSTPKGKCPPSC